MPYGRFSGDRDGHDYQGAPQDYQGGPYEYGDYRREHIRGVSNGYERGVSPYTRGATEYDSWSNLADVDRGLLNGGGLQAGRRQAPLSALQQAGSQSQNNTTQNSNIRLQVPGTPNRNQNMSDSNTATQRLQTTATVAQLEQPCMDAAESEPRVHVASAGETREESEPELMRIFTGRGSDQAIEVEFDARKLCVCLVPVSCDARKLWCP
jgi:hypothetical protein